WIANARSEMIVVGLLSVFALVASCATKLVLNVKNNGVARNTRADWTGNILKIFTMVDFVMGNETEA
ncbi:MAG: hypothetical protein ACK578_11285, partial [Pirellula sp.]